jgi:hypothetical protein
MNHPWFLLVLYESPNTRITLPHYALTIRYPVSLNSSLDACQGDLSRLAILCGNCLLGSTVPAYRPSIQRWHLGQVKAWRNVDTVSGEACLNFDGKTEWVHLESTPFDAYTCHVRECHENENEFYLDRLEDSQNLGDIFRGLSTPESPASSFRIGLQTSEKEYSTEGSAHSFPLFATASPCRIHPLLEHNSEDYYQSEEETTNQKACPRLWSIDVR